VGIFYKVVPKGIERFIFAMWYLYIGNKKDKLYTGITTNIENRVRQHGNIQILYTEEYADKSQAARRERQVKSWSRVKKLSLMNISQK